MERAEPISDLMGRIYEGYSSAIVGTLTLTNEKLLFEGVEHKLLVEEEKKKRIFNKYFKKNFLPSLFYFTNSTL